MKIIGLTGGVGSGKSIVSHLLEIIGIPVYIADAESKRLTDSLPFIREKLTEKFGNDLYPEGKLNKILLASLIFGNENNLRYVNSIIHPAVRNDFEKWKKQYAGFSCVAIEAAILFESGFAALTDVIVTVSAPEALRIQRIEKREGWSRESIVSRIQSQISEEERNCRANYVIYNNNRQALIPQIENLLKKLCLRL
jgi:dephospho-CoA kinase